MESTTKTNAFTKQVGGNHYKDLAIQPMEYCQKNKLGFAESCAIKYLTRYKNKNGKQDLLKAIHNIELLIEMEYPEDCDNFKTSSDITKDVKQEDDSYLYVVFDWCRYSGKIKIANIEELVSAINRYKEKNYSSMYIMYKGKKTYIYGQ